MLPGHSPVPPGLAGHARQAAWPGWPQHLMVTLLLSDGGESSYSFVFHSLISSLPQGMALVIFHIPVYFITEWQKLFTVTHADRIFPFIPEHDLISTLHLLCLNLSLLGERWWVEEQVYCFLRLCLHLLMHLSLLCSSQFPTLWVLNPQPGQPLQPPRVVATKANSRAPMGSVWSQAARLMPLRQEMAANLCFRVPKASVET